MQYVKNFTEFKAELGKNTDLQNQFKEDPLKAIEQFHTALPDTFVYRIVVGSLGFSIIAVIICVTILLYGHSNASDINVPTIFTAISSGAIGALAGLLAPSPKPSSN